VTDVTLSAVNFLNQSSPEQKLKGAPSLSRSLRQGEEFDFIKIKIPALSRNINGDRRGIHHFIERHLGMVLRRETIPMEELR
jgi:hypothetical protein